MSDHPMEEVEQTIHQVERLFTTVTGMPPPGAPGESEFPLEANPIHRLEERVDHLLALLGRTDPRVLGTAGVAVPAMSLWEKPDEYLLCFDLPGVEPEDLELMLDARMLHLRARRAPPAPDGERWLPRHADSSSREYRRSVPLPAPVAREKVTAEAGRGVLRIRLPKAPEEAARIPVRN